MEGTSSFFFLAALVFFAGVTSANRSTGSSLLPPPFPFPLPPSCFAFPALALLTGVLVDPFVGANYWIDWKSEKEELEILSVKELEIGKRLSEGKRREE